jgi:hypothetical protein
MDNAGYHKVRKITDEEKQIFDGRTFSKLKKGQYQQYLTLHGVEWKDDWKRDKLYEVARQQWEAAPPAITEIARRFGHDILFLPPYYSDLNPIENIWGIVKGYVAQNRKDFAMSEVERLTKEGIQHVTSEMWQRAVERVERIELEMFLDDVAEYVLAEPTDRSHPS